MIESFTLFQQLDDRQLSRIEQFSQRKKYRKNTILVEKGDQGSNLYLLEEGLVRIYDIGEDGKEVTLNTIEPGGYFGELALLGTETRTASAITKTDCTVQVLSKPSFLDFLSENPELAVTLMQDMVLQIQALTEEVTALATSDVYGRVARFLKQNARQEEGRTITPRLTQLDIANRVGASREMVSKILGDLRKGGYLSTESKRIVLHKRLPSKW